MSSEISIPLDLPDVQILGSRSEGAERLIVEIRSALTGTPCRRCGHHTEQFHGYDRTIQLQHLPAFGQEVKIEIRPKRYRCLHCEGAPTSTQRCAWYEVNHPCTRAYEKWVMRLLAHSTVADVSRVTGVGIKTIESIFQRYVDSEVDWERLSDLETLGIDEIALRKGHKAYKAVVFARDSAGANHALAVLADRDQSTVEAFLKTIPDRLKATVERVCIDLWAGYKTAVHRALPEAAVVADRFHVARLYRDAVDEVRKRELRRLKAELPEEEAAPCKDAMWPLRRPWPSLRPDQQLQVAQVLNLSPTLKDAYGLREVLSAIFEATTDRATAAERLDAWADEVKRLGASCFDTFLSTLKTWREPILNYFDGRHSSGFVEGLNNKLKLLKRRCFGLEDPVELFRRFKLDLEGEACWSS